MEIYKRTKKTVRLVKKFSTNQPVIVNKMNQFLKPVLVKEIYVFIYVLGPDTQNPS